jgi:Protein of unknown function (DUF3096)
MAMGIASETPKRHLARTLRARARRFSMVLTAASLSPVLAIVFGLLIFVFPKLLNYLVAIYLVLSGLIGLGVLSLR